MGSPPDAYSPVRSVHRMNMLAGKRVLLVEDEILIALDTMDELAGEGCIVLGPALRLAEALAMARSADALDAAVLDVDIAGEYVWPLIDVLNGRRVPFLLLSGFGSALELPLSCRSAPWLGKPLLPGLLVQSLARLLERAASSNLTESGYAGDV